MTAIIEGILVGSVLILIRNIWGYAYSNEVEVIRYVAIMMPILAVSNFLDGLQCVLSGFSNFSYFSKIQINNITWLKKKKTIFKALCPWANMEIITLVGFSSEAGLQVGWKQQQLQWLVCFSAMWICAFSSPSTPFKEKLLLEKYEIYQLWQRKSCRSLKDFSLKYICFPEALRDFATFSKMFCEHYILKF